MHIGLLIMTILGFIGGFIGLFGVLSKTTILNWIGASIIAISVIVGTVVTIGCDTFIKI